MWRDQNLRRGPLPVAGALAWCLATLLAACGSGAGPTPSSGGARPGAAQQAEAALWCRPPGPGPYAGREAGDCVGYAAHHFIVEVDGYEALMGNWKRYTDDQGNRLICAGVNVKDLSATAQPVSAGQFHLRSPSGATAVGRPAPSNGVPSRLLAHGVQQGGGVCWPDHGQGGQYVGTFEPGGAARGVWLVSFLPGA